MAEFTQPWQSRLTSLDLTAKVIKLGDGWQMTSRSTDSLDCLLSKWSDSRSAFPTDSHTSPPPGQTRGGSNELEPSTPDLRVDHHLWRDWTFMRTSIFLTLNWCLAFEYTSLALTWQRTNSSQLTRERSRVHRRWASCLRSKASLHRSSNPYGALTHWVCFLFFLRELLMF